MPTTRDADNGADNGADDRCPLSRSSSQATLWLATHATQTQTDTRNRSHTYARAHERITHSHHTRNKQKRSPTFAHRPKQSGRASPLTRATT